MTNEQWLSFALASMHIGAWYGWRKTDDNGNKIPNEDRMQYKYIKIINDGATMPSEEDVNVKIQQIKDAEQLAKDKKASAKTKLKNLGLDDEELKTLGL